MTQQQERMELSGDSDVESGEIQLDVKTVKTMLKPLREWSNRMHAAVLEEVDSMAHGLPSTGSGLVTARERLTEVRSQRECGGRPGARRLADLLAIAALENHLDKCVDAGRWKKPTAKVLDEYLPKRTGKDTYFRVPDDQGTVPAGLTLDYDSLVWHAKPSADRPAAAARDSPLAAIAFAHLRRVIWKPGMGGEITGPDGRPVLTFP